MCGDFKNQKKSAFAGFFFTFPQIIFTKTFLLWKILVLPHLNTVLALINIDKMQLLL